MPGAARSRKPADAGSVGSRSRVPTFAVIGAQKAASTSLALGLSRHPQIWMPRREQHVFRSHTDGATDIDAFSTLFATRREPVLGWKCPDYLGSPDVPGRLAHELPELRLVACLRDPVDRAISAYFWYVRWGVLPRDDPTAGLERLLDASAAAGGPPDDGTALSAESQVLTYGLYGRHLRTWQRHFDSTRILVLDHPRDAADLDRLLTRTETFLGVAPTGRPRPRPRNEAMYSPARQRLAGVRNKHVVVGANDDAFVAVHYPRTAWGWIVTGAVAGGDRVLRSVVNDVMPTIDPATIARLRDFYAEDQALLATIVPIEQEQA